MLRFIRALRLSAGARWREPLDRGAVATEYSLIGVLVAVAIVIMVTLLGDQVLALFASATDAIAAAGFGS